MFNHIDPNKYQEQLSGKHNAMADLFAELNVPDFEIYTSDPINYRQRAEFRVWHEGEDLFYIMFDQKTKQKFRVDNFPVACALINQLMNALLENIKDKETLRKRLFQVDFLATLSGEAVISLLYHKQLDDKWQIQALELREILSKICPVNIIGRAKKQKIIINQDFVFEKLNVLGKEFTYQQVENSFTQPNAKVNEKMLAWAQTATQSKGGDLIELYCGNGNFSIALAQNFDRVIGTEISKTSVKSAQVNIEINNIDNIDIVRMSSEEFSQAMSGERKFRRLADFNLTDYNFDTVLVDPPRAGLDPDSIELVRQFNDVIYISCNPETLKENLKALLTTHKIKKIALFDQFPYTHHIETGVILSRK